MASGAGPLRWGLSPTHILRFWDEYSPSVAAQKSRFVHRIYFGYQFVLGYSRMRGAAAERVRVTVRESVFLARELVEGSRLVGSDEHFVGDGQTHIKQLLCNGGDVVVRLADGRHEQVLLAGD